MIWYININKHVIAKNAKQGTSEPPVRVSRGRAGKAVYCSEVGVPAGSRIIYSPHLPLMKCGARLVIECPSEPEVLR